MLDPALLLLSVILHISENLTKGVDVYFKVVLAKEVTKKMSVDQVNKFRVTSKVFITSFFTFIVSFVLLLQCQY